MRLFFTSFIICLMFLGHMYAQKIWTVPKDFRVDSTVTIYFDLKKCMHGKDLLDKDSLYFWSHTPTWAGDSLQGKWENSSLPSLMKHEGDNVWSFTLVPTEFYNWDSAGFASSEWWVEMKVKNPEPGVGSGHSINSTEYMGVIRHGLIDLQIPGAFAGRPQMQYRFRRLDVSNQILADPEKALSIEEVVNAFDQGDFQFFDLMEDDAYMLKPFWQYTQVRNPDTLPHTFTISVGLFGGSWDDVMIYVRDKAGKLDTLASGYSTPRTEKAMGGWRNMFQIELGPGESKQLFVRVADFDSHDTMPPTEFLWEIDFPHLKDMEIGFRVRAAFMIAILAFSVSFYFFWFFMSRKKEHVFHSLLWLGFLLSVIIPSPMGSFFVINEIAPIVTSWFHLSMGWLLVSSVTLWGLLGFSVHYLEFKKYAPKAIRIAWILALFPLLLFLVGGVNYIAPEIFPYNHYSWDGFFYFPSTNIRSVLMAIAFLFVAIMAIRVHLKGFKPARFYLIAFVPLIVAACLVSMSNLRMAFKGNAIGLPDALNLLNYASMILALVLFGLALGYKQRRLEKEHIESQNNLLTAREKALEEEKRANEQRIQLREREISLQEERNKREQLRDLNELKNRFFTNITHEFRTPLTVIMGMGENIKGNEKEKELILRNSQNLLRLINQLLDLAKLEQGDLPLNMEQADVVAYTRYLTESFYSIAQEKNIRLTFYSEEERYLMDFDKEKLRYIVYNLLSNAFKFTPNGGKVILHLMPENGFQRIRVQDTGIGIPPNKLPHIFDRFYQANDSDSNKTEGTGIGLAYTKELVKLLGGRIEVQSEVGQGTTFDCYIPISREAPLVNVESVKREETTVPVVEEASADLMGSDTKDLPIVLIVEDNPDLVTYMKSILGRNYQLNIARDGEAGIQKALELVPDIVVSDIMMPIKDGYELCETLKSDIRTSHIPVILLTAKASQEDKVAGLRYGADAYLLKPFHEDELQVRMTKLIELRQQLQRRYEGNEPQNKDAPTLEDTFLEEVKTLVESQLDNPDLSIPELAKSMGMSQTQLYRKLKALTGGSPSKFVRLIRLETGKKLLIETDMNVSEIAYQVGFSDPNYFTKSFSEAYGSTPSDFRKRL